MLDSLAVVGLLAVLATGEFERKTALFLLLGLIVAIVVPASIREKRPVQFAGTVTSVGALIIQISRLTTSANVVTLVLEFAALLQIVRLATRRGAAHDQQIIVLALLHLIAATILGAGLGYAACFIGFMFLTPVTLLLSHLRREVEGNYRQGARDRSGLPVDVPRILRSRRVVSPAYLGLVICLSLPMFAFTGLLFVAFPRVGLSLLLLQPPRKSRIVGFSDRVDLGVVGKLHSDPSVALRITYPELPEHPPEHLAVYLRGAALDHYDGAAWSKTQSTARAAEHEGALYRFNPWPSLNGDRSLTIELAPIEPPIVFLPADVAAIQVLPQARGEMPEAIGLFRNSEGEFRYVAESSSGLRYRVFLDERRGSQDATLTPSERAKYLMLPPRLSNRVEELARSWVGSEAEPLNQSKLLEDHLRRDFVYDLDSPSGGAANPMEDFLFSSHRGHCEYYATAMAVMLRTLGIPSRNVTGFGAASFNRFGRFYVVRQSDAHSWVEAWIDDIGWRRFDPTPPIATIQSSELSGLGRVVRELIEAAAQRWSRHVEGYDVQQQLGLAWKIRVRVERLGLSRWMNTLGRPRTLAILAILVLSVTLLGKFLRKRRAGTEARRAPQATFNQPSMQAIQLYRRLERALTELGIPRPESTPPWGYARSLQRLGHPMADSIVELTGIYLEARFGERPITEADVEAFNRTLALLRQTRIRDRAA